MLLRRRTPDAASDSPDTASDSLEDLRAKLDELRTDLLLSRGARAVDARTLAARIHSCNLHFIECSQEAALDVAESVALKLSHCLPLLQRAAAADPDDETGLTAASSAMINTLGGSGMHTYTFSPVPSVRLRLRSMPQATGTHGRVWRAAGVLARACADGWGGVRVAGAHVVELGCGTAAAGLACASLGAAATWLTDVEEGALELARTNAALNRLTECIRVCHVDVERVGELGEGWPAVDGGAAADDAEAGVAASADTAARPGTGEAVTPSLPRFDLVLAA